MQIKQQIHQTEKEFIEIAIHFRHALQYTTMVYK